MAKDSPVSGRASLLDRSCDFKIKTLKSALAAEEHKVKRHAHFAEKQRILDMRDMIAAQKRHAKWVLLHGDTTMSTQ